MFSNFLWINWYKLKPWSYKVLTFTFSWPLMLQRPSSSFQSPSVWFQIPWVFSIQTHIFGIFNEITSYLFRFQPVPSTLCENRTFELSYTLQWHLSCLSCSDFVIFWHFNKNRNLERSILQRREKTSCLIRMAPL